ncbi:MAG: hypothetical protein AAF940_09630 [Pseudomonadota bacterium]
MIDYAFYQCECVMRILRGDPSAIDDMDITTNGFWRSFEAILLALPAMFFTWVVFSQQLLAGGVIGSTLSLMARQAGIDLLLWVLPIALLALIMPWLGVGRNFTALIIARNWLSLIIVYLVAAMTMIDLLMAPSADVFVSLLFLATLIISIWMFIRVSLAALPANRGIAYGIVMLEVVLVFTVADLLSDAMGLTGTV